MGQPVSLLSEWRELRILVLHNRDFDPESGAGGGDPDFTSRADVVNAARDVARALASRGHFVEVRGTDVSDVGRLLGQIEQDRPDLVFNLCESLGGDARNEVVIPSLLDMLHIPYTGSGPLSLGLSLRKDRAKELLLSAGVPTPAAVVLPEAPQDPEDDLLAVRRARLRYPLIVKPTREDASVGISPASVVDDDDALCTRVAAMRAAYGQPILAEEFIEGRELYASLIGPWPMQVLPLHEIDFSLMPKGRPHIVCYEAKWNPSSPECAGTRPTRAGLLSSDTQERIEEAARAAFMALRISDYGRCDVRLASDGTPYIIDINPNCDLSDGAGFSMAARLGGLAYDEMIERIAACALLRCQHADKRASQVLHVVDPAGAAGGPDAAASARVQGRAVLAERGQLRARTHRQRAL